MTQTVKSTIVLVELYKSNKVIPSTSMREQHGTHVSGIIAAVENGEGTVGLHLIQN